MDKFLAKLDKSIWGISIYFILGAIVLVNSCGTSFVDDSLEWIVSYKKFGWNDFWHSYDMTSVYWFHDFFSNIMYLIFGKNNHAWFYVILFFHTTACYYFYRFLKNVFEYNQRVYSNLIAFNASMIFMFGAYNTENLFWIATYHYEITIVYLMICLFIISENKGLLSKIQLIGMLIPFPFMLTMHEISFFFSIVFQCAVKCLPTSPCMSSSGFLLTNLSV